MNAAHKITARGYAAVVRGYRLGGSRLQTCSSRRQIRPNARVHFAEVTSRQVEAAKLDAAITGSLEELGHGS